MFEIGSWLDSVDVGGTAVDGMLALASVLPQLIAITLALVVVRVGLRWVRVYLEQRQIEREDYEDYLDRLREFDE